MTHSHHEITLVNDICWKLKNPRVKNNYSKSPTVLETYTRMLTKRNEIKLVVYSQYGKWRGRGKKSNITTCYSIRVSCMQPYTYIYQCTVYFHDINSHASISPWITLFRVSSKASLEVFSSLSICWSGEVFIFNSFLNDSILGSFLFQHLEYIIPLSPGYLGFCFEICLETYECSFVSFKLLCFALIFFFHALRF